MYRGMHCCPPNTLVKVPNVLEVVGFYAVFRHRITQER
jgi:hypothetical protein